jgi:Fe-S-cluster containining protein
MTTQKTPEKPVKPSPAHRKLWMLALRLLVSASLSVRHHMGVGQRAGGVTIRMLSSTDTMAHFARIDTKVANAAAASGFACPEGCGKCCTTPNVEATETECVPVALALVDQGKGEDVLKRIDAARTTGDRTCVLYEPSSSDGAFGRCSQYKYRPGLCRLFGFSGRLSSTGAPEWIACRTMQDLAPPAMEVMLAQHPPECMPIIADELARFANPVPINEALRRALSSALTQAMYSKVSDGVGSNEEAAV